MAFTTTQVQTIIDQLYDVLASKGGIMAVQFEGRVIKYSSLDEVTRALKYWQGVLGRLDGSRPKVAQHDLGEFN